MKIENMSCASPYNLTDNNWPIIIIIFVLVQHGCHYLNLEKQHNFLKIPSPHPLCFGNHQLFLYLCVSVCLFIYFIFHIVLVRSYCISLSVWLISLSIMHSKFIHFVTNGKMSFFFIAEYSPFSSSPPTAPLFIYTSSSSSHLLMDI